MKTAFYAPFKALDHPKPSGDRTIGQGLTAYLSGQGFEIQTVSRLRSRWIYWRPWLWPGLLFERRNALQRASGADIWLTYHNYYKSPDLLGPFCARKLGIPYVIFQASYSTKHAKRVVTWPGFALSRQALLASRHIFVNRRSDYENLLRILPEERVSYVAPGIFAASFQPDQAARRELRAQAGLGREVVFLSVAMFRNDVKTKGLLYLIERLGELSRQGLDFKLWLAGDGPGRARIEDLARRELPGLVKFLGLVPREQLKRYYSAADVFAFPGINESLGMVYLEAQACGLPVAAFADAGVPEVVKHGRTGLLCQPFDAAGYAGNLRLLAENENLRLELGRNAADFVARERNLEVNYAGLSAKLKEMVYV